MEEGAEPSVTRLEDASGNLTGFKVTGSFTDPGTKDFHKITVTWGSLGTSVVTLDPGVLNFDITKNITGDTSGLSPITIKVEDDDGGSDTQTVKQCTICRWRRHTGGTFDEMDSHVEGTPVQDAIDRWIDDWNTNDFGGVAPLTGITGPGGAYTSENTAPFTHPVIGSPALDPREFKVAAAVVVVSLDVCGNCTVTVEEFERKLQHWDLDTSAWVDDSTTPLELPPSPPCSCCCWRTLSRKWTR